MPNIWTHNLFGRQLIDEFSEKLSSVDSHRTLFHLGCQGPDFLFYHHFLPWQRDQRMALIGGRMHREHCGPVLVDFFEKTLRMKQQTEQQKAQIYFLGFLMHHILDRNMHPFIHSKSGYRKWDHQRFEVILDTLIVEKMLHKQTWETPVWKEIDAIHELSQPILDIMEETAATWYTEAGSVPSTYWKDAYRDMIRAQKLFHDPLGWKRVLTLGQITPMVYLKKNAPLDYLNESKASWPHPAVEGELYTDSFWELWESALSDGRKVLQALIEWLHTETDASIAKEKKHQFVEALGNLSYDTGKDCDQDFEVQFSQSIWE